jgi:hypothetical protein
VPSPISQRFVRVCPSQQHADIMIPQLSLDPGESWLFTGYALFAVRMPPEASAITQEKRRDSAESSALSSSAVEVVAA